MWPGQWLPEQPAAPADPALAERLVQHLVENAREDAELPKKEKEDLEAKWKQMAAEKAAGVVPEAGREEIFPASSGNAATESTTASEDTL